MNDRTYVHVDGNTRQGCWARNAHLTLRHLYPLWCRTQARKTLAWKRCWDIVEQVHDAGGVAWVKPTHKHAGNQHWWRYHVYEWDRGGEKALTFDFTWEDGPGDASQRLIDLGTALYRAYDLGRTWNMRAMYVRAALGHLLEEHVRQVTKPKYNDVVTSAVHYGDHVFFAKAWRAHPDHADTVVVSILWPDETKVIDLRGEEG